MDESSSQLSCELGTPFGSHHVVVSKMTVAGVDHFILGDNRGLDIASGYEHEDNIAVVNGGQRAEHAMRCEDGSRWKSLLVGKDESENATTM